MNLLELTEEQQNLIWETWSKNPAETSISDLVKLIFPAAKNFDPRTNEGKTIRKFLVLKGATPPDSTYQKKTPLELTEEQKEYIKNNYMTMKSVEMARVLFNNNNLTPVSMEARSIFGYIKEFNKLEPTLDIVNKQNATIIKDDDIGESEYKPPNTIDKVCAKVNKYVKGANLDFRNLKVSQRRQCQSLLHYLFNHRFNHQINSLAFQDDKNLLESAFVDYTWDKDDLSAEDIDQYIILCNDKVVGASIQRNINQLERDLQRIIEEEGKMSMTHVEALKSARTEYNDCIKRQINLYKGLTEERSDRLANKKMQTPSLLNLIALWKEEETRLEIIKLADERQQKLGEEVDRLHNMDQLKLFLCGISKEEVLYG